MRVVLSFLMAVAALALTPAGAWAEAGHGHCEEPGATAQTAAPPVTVSTPAALEAPTGPCGECPDASCSTHRHCAAGTPPVVAEAGLAESMVPSGSATGAVTSAPFRASFDPTPPTPPPNLRTL